MHVMLFRNTVLFFPDGLRDVYDKKTPFGGCADCGVGYQCGMGTAEIGTEGEQSRVLCDSGYWTPGVTLRSCVFAVENF